MNLVPDKPRYCVWEITLACNMRCLHCGSYAGYKRTDEMSLDQMLDVADQLADIGVQRLTISGGEPLLRKDWDRIAARLMDRGVRVGMISNGFKMLDNLPKIMELQRSHRGFEVIAMSVDGLRDTHDAFRRVPGSFDRISAAYKELSQRKIYTAAITSVSTLNLGQLDELHDTLASLGVRAWQLQTLFGGGRMRERPDLMPGPEVVETLARFIARKRASRSPMQVFPADCIGYFTELEEAMRGFRWFGCQAGLTAIGVEANGNVKGCLSMCPELLEDNPFVEGNLHDEKLIDIWNKPGAFAYNRQFDPAKAQGFCRTCDHLSECRCGCSAQAHFATGTVYENPYCVHRLQAERAASPAAEPPTRPAAGKRKPTSGKTRTGRSSEPAVRSPEA